MFFLEKLTKTTKNALQNSQSAYLCQQITNNKKSKLFSAVSTFNQLAAINKLFFS